MPVPPGYKIVQSPPPGYQLVEDKPGAEAKPPKGSMWEDAFSALTGAWEQLNPVEQAKGLYGLSEAIGNHPVDTGKALLDAQGNLAMKAKESFEKGDYLQGLRHSLAYLIPMYGPAIDEMGNKVERGEDVAKTLGSAVGMGLSARAPGVFEIPGAVRSGVRALRGQPPLARPLGLPNPTGVYDTPTPYANPNPEKAAAIEFLQKKGVEVPAGPATGSDFIMGAQKMGAFTPGGNVVAERANPRIQGQLSGVADELATTAHPDYQSPLLAGEDVRGALVDKRRVLGQQANRGYEPMHAAEADPANTRNVQIGMEQDPQGNMVPVMGDVALPIDLRPFKDSLRRLHGLLGRRWTPANRSTSEAFTAIHDMVGRPDHVPLSEAEDGLGGLKALIRENPESEEARIAIPIAERLQREINQTANATDPDILWGLTQGRQLTRHKYIAKEATDALGRLENEGVRDYLALTLPEDKRIGRLRTVAHEVPGEMPKVARAWLEDLWSKARAEGGFAHGDKLFAEWEKLGDETKKILFPNPTHRADLDKFFLGMKEMAKNPNPSGTAAMSWINKIMTGEFILGAGVGHTLSSPELMIGTGVANAAAIANSAALTKLLYSPKGVKLLTQGMRIDTRSPARAVWLGNVMKTLNDEQEKEKQDAFLKAKGKPMLDYSYQNPAADPRR